MILNSFLKITVQNLTQEINKSNKLEDKVLVQEFTINELKKKVQVEDAIKNMEKELDEKDKLLNNRDKKIIMLEDKISELSDFSRKTGSNFNKTENQLKNVQEEIAALLKKNVELNSKIDELKKKLSESEESWISKEEIWNVKYHSIMRALSELEEKSNNDVGKNHKEFEHLKAENLDLRDLLTQRELRVKTLDELVKQLKDKLQKQEKLSKDLHNAEHEISNESIIYLNFS